MSVRGRALDWKIFQRCEMIHGKFHIDTRTVCNRLLRQSIWPKHWNGYAPLKHFPEEINRENVQIHVVWASGFRDSCNGCLRLRVQPWRLRRGRHWISGRPYTVSYPIECLFTNTCCHTQLRQATITCCPSLADAADLGGAWLLSFLCLALIGGQGDKLT